MTNDETKEFKEFKMINPGLPNVKLGYG